MATQTPNMNLYLPTIGVDSGLTWEQDVNANSSILDGHNHSVGSGAQINPSGLNINSDLPFNNNNAITLRSSRFSVQMSPLSLPADLNCVYFSGVDLYVNDGNGNQIQMTQGGSVNATSSGISSGTATASFSGATLVVNAASNTPANIQGASILLGNTGVSGSKYVTLSPPSALGANYNLTLPPIPAQTNVMTLDTSGNMNSITYDQVGVNMTSVGAQAIATTMGTTGANTIAANRTRTTGSSTVGIGGVAISSGSGVAGATSSSFSNVPNLSVQITTSGRPIYVGLVPDTVNSSGFGSVFWCNWNGSPGQGPVGAITFSDGTTTYQYSFTGFGSGAIIIPVSAASALFYSAAGTYTFTVQYRLTSGTTSFIITDARLTAYEL